MNYDPLLETMMVDWSLEKIDQVQMEKEVERLKKENSNLKKQLGIKKTNNSYEYEELVDENIKLKKQLGISEDEIMKSIKENSPYKKSTRVWIFYMIFSGIILLGMIIFLIVLLNKF